MNWLDTQTKELLQKAGDEELAPPKTGEFALVLIRKGRELQRLIKAIIQTNKCSESEARILANRYMPLTINPDLTEEEALWGQFELICCDAISIFLRSEVMEQNDKWYLEALFNKVLKSDEFKPTTVSITEVPKTESGEKFIAQFLGDLSATPITLTFPFKKARIMEHWAKRVGVQMKFNMPTTAP